MVLCKDCFHREVCELWTTSLTTMNLDDIPPEIPCGHFKDTADIAPRAEWISVEERLPEESCECLAVSGNGVTYLLYYSHRYKAFNATDDDDGDRWKLGGFTHWMHLPEPPVMKGE